jgi:hypothetical protein
MAACALQKAINSVLACQKRGPGRGGRKPPLHQQVFRWLAIAGLAQITPSKKPRP